jgi:hypothetical protein
MENKIIGVKNDFADGKLRWSLLPLDAVEEIVKVLEHGAKKYSVDNWKYVENGTERYWDSLVRHIMAWKQGEIIDPESGLSHLAHAGCNVLFLLYLAKAKTPDVTKFISSLRHEGVIIEDPLKDETSKDR